MNKEHLKELTRLTKENKIQWEKEEEHVMYGDTVRFYSTEIPGVQKMRLGFGVDFVVQGDLHNPSIYGGTEIYPFIDALKKAIRKQLTPPEKLDPLLQILRSM